MILVYFVYGLAFFSMGFAIALESRQSSGLRLAGSLPFLAAFGLLHSLVEWADTLTFVNPADLPSLDLESVRLVRTLLLGISTGALLQFGADLLSRARDPRLRTERPAPGQFLGGGGDFSNHRPWFAVTGPWLRWLPLVLGLVWVATLLLLSADYPVGSRQWGVHGDIWARYLLYFPGSLLVAFALAREAGLLQRTEYRQITLDIRLAAATFAVNGIIAGLVVPPGQQFPTSPLNYDSFAATFGFPVQLMRAGSALAIAFFVLRVLRVFRLQSLRRIEQATLEERDRLAREMHDSLAQVLGLLGIKTRGIEQLVASGRLEQAETELAQMKKIIQDAYADVRQSILGLRTATELGRGLAAAIRESADDFADQNSIPVELALAEEGEVSFPAVATAQLVRIVQEALANVRKHSKATRVWIRLERRGGEAVLVVEDDGLGFDPALLAGRSRHSFGLGAMRERSESIGADLEVTSIPGEGTRIQVRFPLERRTTEPRPAPQNPAG